MLVTLPTWNVKMWSLDEAGNPQPHKVITLEKFVEVTVPRNSANGVQVQNLCAARRTLEAGEVVDGVTINCRGLFFQKEA